MQLVHSETSPDRSNRAAERDLSLAARYASTGPRYTSYPTAVEFRDPAAISRYEQWVEESASASIAPLSLYVHLPFCSDICYYCACNKVVTRDCSAASDYIDRLEREVELQSARHGARRPITQMHWGGGTPTYLDDAELTRLMHLLASHFNLLDRDDREYSIEIDPRTVNTDTLALLKGLGFNRISLGVQDFDPLVQKSVNRTQPFSRVAALVDSVRRLGFRSLGFDLIYGLPYQDEQSITETLRKVIALAPDRIACYNYAHLPERFSSQRAIDRLTLPVAEEKLLLHEIIREELQRANYIHIGMDHFVLPGDELAKAQSEGRLQRNFQGYALRLADDLLGLGVSAISQVGDFYVQNERELGKYYGLLDEGRLPHLRGLQLSAEDRLRKHIIMGLICDMRLDIDAVNQKYGIDFNQRFRSELAQLATMQEDSLVAISEKEISVTEAGRPFLRNLCMVFDAYLVAAERTSSSAGFSATV